MIVDAFTTTIACDCLGRLKTFRAFFLFQLKKNYSSHHRIESSYARVKRFLDFGFGDFENTADREKQKKNMSQVRM